MGLITQLQNFKIIVLDEVHSVWPLLNRYISVCLTGCKQNDVRQFGIHARDLLSDFGVKMFWVQVKIEFL